MTATGAERSPNPSPSRNILTATGAECSLDPPPTPACPTTHHRTQQARKPDHPPQGDRPAPPCIQQWV